MSYYIIPKIVNKLHIEVAPVISSSCPRARTPYLSHSLWKYFLQMHRQLSELLEEDTENLGTIDDAIKLVNPYEYLFTKVPGSTLPVSKLTFKTSLFYDLLELHHNLILFDPARPIQSLHVSCHCEESMGVLEIVRDKLPGDHHSGAFSQSDLEWNFEDKYHFLYYDSHHNAISFLKALMVVICHQAADGVAVIHLAGIFEKLVVDGIFLLSSLFHKVYISKPCPNNVASFSKYIVCKGFHCKDETYLHEMFAKLMVFAHIERNEVGGLFAYDVPCYFRNKLDEVNVIIGQQQLESMELVLSIHRNKNRHDKIENVKKANIQKSILWCEKYKIPCNRFSGKVNIFLPIATESGVEP
jgi:hypothetical protein